MQTSLADAPQEATQITGPLEAPRDHELGRRLRLLTSIIAEHRMAQYDIDGAIGAWRDSGLHRGDRLLTALIHLYAHPWYAVAGLILLFYLPETLVSVTRTEACLGCAWSFEPRAFVGGLLIVAMIGFLVVSGAAVIQRLVSHQYHYFHLFMPRLFGAIVVGLSILSLNDTPWEIALAIPPLTALITIVALISFCYLYIVSVVYRALRLASPSAPAGAHANGDTALSQVAGVSGRILAVGLVQALFATTIVSMLLLPVFVSSQGITSGTVVAGGDHSLAVATGGPVWQVACLGYYSLTVYVGALRLDLVLVPSQVLLWSAMALFIGVFVQLLWQDRRVVSSVGGDEP